MQIPFLSRRSVQTQHPRASHASERFRFHTPPLGRTFRPSYFRRALFFQPLAVLLAFLIGSPLAELQAQIATQPTVFTPVYPTSSTNTDTLGNLNILPTASPTPPSNVLIISTQNLPPVTGELTLGSTVQTIPSVGFFANRGYTGPPSGATAAACTPDGIQSEIVQCRTFQGNTFPAEWETNAITTYLLSHGLPPSDAAYIFQYGRTDLRSHLRGFLLSLIVAIINKPAASRSANEAAVYNWLTQLVSGREIAAATFANNEYQNFLSNCPSVTYQVNETIVNNLGIQNSDLWCQGHQSALSSAFEVGYYPSLSYFQAVGEADAYVAPLGAVGTVALTIAQSDFLHSTFVGTQATAANQAQYAAYSSATSGTAAGAAVYTNYSDIFPFLSQLNNPSTSASGTLTAADPSNKQLSKVLTL